MKKENPNTPGKYRKLYIGLSIGAGALLVALVLFVLVFNKFSLRLELHGPEKMTIRYGESYDEMGATPLFSGTIIYPQGYETESRVEISSNLDVHKAGTYEITYTATHMLWNAQAKRTVTVIDDVPPEITLLGDSRDRTLTGRSYDEEGFRAYDEHDGDITHLVVRQEKDGKVYYRVTDSSGNQAEAVREIIYLDPNMPQLILRGEEEITLTAGTPYLEPGYEAMDIGDGLLTSQVEVDGEVNYYRGGTYTLRYHVTDSKGHTTEKQRTVHVQTVPQPETVMPQGKVIYLTFDDGPSIYTEKLLDTLKAYNVKATFFVVDSGCYDTMRRIVEEGHAIAIHSIEHDYRTIYASMDAFFEDLYATQAMIYEQTGVKTTLMRFPGGSSNTVSRFNPGVMTRLTQAVEAAGFQYFDWNVDSDDAGKAKTTAEVYKNVIGNVGYAPYSIVLQHDTKECSVEAVEKIILWGLANGYTFLPLEPSSPTVHHPVGN